MKTRLSDRNALLKALNDVGFSSNKLRVHETAQQLQGYQGDMREQTAEIVIPRAHVGGSSNDIGFKLQEDGTYQAIISQYDSGKYSGTWLKKLNQRYVRAKLIEQVEEKGFFITEEREENGEIFIEIDPVGWVG